MTLEPVPRPLLRRLWLAVAGAGLFFVVAVAQGAFRPEYDPWHQAVSALSLGTGGWIQSANFVLLGLVVLSTVPVWRLVLRGGRGAAAYPALTALAGGSFVVLAFLPQDPAPGYDPERLALTAPTLRGLLHLAVAAVAAAASIAALFVMAGRLARPPEWRGWAHYTCAIAVLTVACVAVYAVWSTRATGFAGTFERLAIVLPAAWAFTFLRRLAAGAPFVVQPVVVSGVAYAAGEPPGLGTPPA